MIRIGYQRADKTTIKGKAFALTALAVSAALAATVAAPTPAMAELVAIRFGDGTTLTPGTPATGPGWDYDGGETLTLDGYDGDFIEVTGSASIVVAGDSSVSGDNKAIFSSNEHLDITGKNGATLTVNVNGGSYYPDASGVFGSTGIDVTDLNIQADVTSANPVANVSIVGTDSGDISVTGCSISGTASGSSNTYGIAMAEENGRGDVTITDCELDISTVAMADEQAFAAAVRGTSALVSDSTATFSSQAEGGSAIAAGVYAITDDAEIRGTSLDANVDATSTSGDARSGALMGPISGLVGGGSTVVSSASATSNYGEATAGAIVSTVGLSASDGLTAHVNGSTLSSTSEAVSSFGRASAGATVDAQGVSVVSGAKVNSSASAAGGSSDSIAVGLGALAGNTLVEDSVVNASGSNTGKGWSYGVGASDTVKITDSKITADANSASFRSIGVLGKSAVSANASTVESSADLVGMASGPDGISLTDCKAISPVDAVIVPMSISSDDVTVEGHTLGVGISNSVFDAQSDSASVTSGVASDVTIDQEKTPAAGGGNSDNPGSEDGTYPDSDGTTVLPATDDPMASQLVVIFGVLFAGAFGVMGLSVLARRN